MSKATVTSQNQVPLRILEGQNSFDGFKSRKPFLKWAGGKTQLISSLLQFIPIEFSKYIEPFIGGGALFFALSHQQSIISDANEELVITYRAVRDNVESVIELLDNHKNEQNYFYEIRSKETSELSNIERAARLVYLNKTCFNGLYRVNKKGKFNVPYNKRDGTNFYNKETLIEASKALNNTKIYYSDYKEILANFAEKDDFIFLDPPYQPIGKYSDFKRYTEEFFYEQDQIELSEKFYDLVNFDCKAVSFSSERALNLN